MLSKLENFIFSELVDLRKQRKTKKSTHRSLGIATYNICGKLQGKILNPTSVGAPGILCFLNENKSLSKITHQYFLITKFVLESNFHDIQKLNKTIQVLI